MEDSMFDFDLQLFADGDGGSEESAGGTGGNPAGATDAGGGENKPMGAHALTCAGQDGRYADED